MLNAVIPGLFAISRVTDTVSPADAVADEIDNVGVPAAETQITIEQNNASVVIIAKNFFTLFPPFNISYNIAQCKISFQDTEEAH